MADEPEAGDRGELVGLRGRPDLNGRRVEVKGPATGADGGPRLAVRLLFGDGAGTMMKVKAANLELDKARDTLETAMQALAPGADPEEWRDWAGGLPALVLGKVVETLIAQDEAVWAAALKQRNPIMTEEQLQEAMAQRKQDGNCLFVLAMVCKQWRKAQQKVGGRLRTRVESDVVLPGSVALAKWALAEGCPRQQMISGESFSITASAAEFGHMELVQWLIQEQGFEMHEGVMGMAAHSGNLNLVKWLRGNGCDWDTSACRSAATYGHLGVLKWLRASGCPWNVDTCTGAAVNSQLETLRWARENGCDWNTDACTASAQNGHLKILQWLRANGCPWNAHTSVAAAAQGQLETLRWARENGCDWDAEVCEAAARSGHLKILQWLRAEGCPWDAETSYMAAFNGHLEVLRWARENGCDLNAETCLNAADGGHLEILQWLRAEGCPWDSWTCHHAVNRGHVEVLRWARENGCEWDAETRDRAVAELGYTDDLGNLVG